MRFFAAFQKFQRLQTRLALLVALLLVTHSLDVCAAHTGIPGLAELQPVTEVDHQGADCSAPPGVACLCAKCACVPFPKDTHHSDGCSVTSELSTPAKSIANHLHAPLILVPLFATVPDAIEAPAPPAFVFGRDGPQHARLRSQFLFSPLPGRAPPVTL